MKQKYIVNYVSVLGLRDKLSLTLKIIFLGVFIFIEYKFNKYLETFGVRHSYIEAFLFYVTSLLFVSISKIIIKTLYLRKLGVKANYQDNFIIGINQIAQLLSFFLFISAVLIFFNVDFGQVFTSLSIVAAALALLFKDYVANAINGMIIMFSNQISLNDRVKMGEHKGKIVNITLLNVQLVNDDEDLIYIPNTAIFAMNVINYTKRAINKISIEFEIDYKHLKNIEDLEKELICALAPFVTEIIPESYHLKIVALRSNCATLKFQYIPANQDRNFEKQIRKIIERKLLEYVITHEVI
jgi:small-conductance mechanosensitive channel